MAMNLMVESRKKSPKNQTWNCLKRKSREQPFDYDPHPKKQKKSRNFKRKQPGDSIRDFFIP